MHSFFCPKASHYSHYFSAKNIAAIDFVNTVRLNDSSTNDFVS